MMLVGFASACWTKNINNIWGWLTMGLAGLYFFWYRKLPPR